MTDKEIVKKCKQDKLKSLYTYIENNPNECINMVIKTTLSIFVFIFLTPLALIEITGLRYTTIAGIFAILYIIYFKIQTILFNKKAKKAYLKEQGE